VLTVTALQEIPSPPGTATVRIDVEIDGSDDEASDGEAREADSDPVDDALAGAGRAAGGLIAGAGKMIAGVVRAVAPDDDE